MKCIQKQPSVVGLIKRWSENMQQIYRRTPMTKWDFSKVANQLYFLRLRNIFWQFLVVSSRIPFNSAFLIKHFLNTHFCKSPKSMDFRIQKKILKVQSCKLHNYKCIITSTQVTHVIEPWSFADTQKRQ